MSVTFTNLYGLCALIAIPILIIIYLIKNKFTEQVVSTTYIWTLSEKFLKKKKPVSRLASILSLLVQILAVVFISITICQPVIYTPNGADSYVFVLDASASMQIEENGVTRFDAAKEKIAEIISSSPNGSKFTIVHAGESVSVVCEEEESPTRALNYLDTLEVEDSSSTLTNAQNTVQAMFSAHPYIKTYVVSDKAFDTINNAQLILVSNEAQNYSILQASYFLKDEKLYFSGKAISHKSDAQMNVDLLLNGNTTPIATISITLPKGEEVDFEIESPTTSFNRAQLQLSTSDGLKSDDCFILYNDKGDATTHSILIVSDNDFFLRETFESMGFGNIDTKLTTDTDIDLRGYSLYVFDNYVPSVLPLEGEVWFVNPTDKVNDLNQAQFSVNAVYDDITPIQIDYSTSTSSLVKRILQYTSADSSFNELLGGFACPIYLKGYSSCTYDGSFTPIMYCDNDPVLFIGENANHQRQVVFAFDFQRSDFVVQYDYMVIMSNLIDYTFPEMLSERNFVCGDSVEINTLNNCDTIKLITPSGEIISLENTNSTNTYVLSKVGEYTVEQRIGTEIKTSSFFVALNKAEGSVNPSEASFDIQGESSSERLPAKYEDLIAWFILLALAFLIDWVVYCYEQYQLR